MTVQIQATEEKSQLGPLSSPMTTYSVRLSPGLDIVTELQKLVKDNNLQASFVLTCVGSVTKAKLRMANSHKIHTYQSGPYEIVSLVGTLSAGGHLHASLSDAEGKVFGGHVIGELIIFTTAEIVVGEATGLTYTRAFDVQSGYDELVVAKRP